MGFGGDESDKEMICCCTNFDKKCKGINWRKIVRKRIPITTWLPKYSKEYGISDLIAGITVGLTIVPQSMAYASVVGLSPEVYTIFQIPLC